MPNIYIPITSDTPETILRHIYAVASDIVNAAGIISAQTSGIENTFAPLPARACKQLTVFNLTGTTLSFKRNGTGPTFEIPDGVSWMFRGLSDANDLSVMRSDGSGLPVTFKAEWEN
jgi:hypothetical protein